MKKKTCLLGGVMVDDIIKKWEYPDGFEPGKKNNHKEILIRECIGGTCGNVSTMLPYLGVQTYPIAHFDLSKQGLRLKKDMEEYGADVRFVRNSEKGKTTLMHFTHKRDNKTGEHKLSRQRTGTDPNSRFGYGYKAPRGKDEAPAIIAALDFVPDVFFFDSADFGYRVIAEGLREKGSLVYFEPENDKDKSPFDKSVALSDVVKFSGEKITDLSFCDKYNDKLFIQTLGAEGLKFSLRGGEWQKVEPIPNDNVVDWEGAGDWTTSQFIACLCEKEILSVKDMNEDNVRECLEKACETASRSVSFMTSKGMIDAEKA